MKILVTGATGFIGQHVVSALLHRGHDITAVYRDTSKAACMPWKEKVQLVVRDIHSLSENALRSLVSNDVLVHLAWPGLPNYRDRSHFEKTLLYDYAFLKSMVEFGIRQILVSGTCFEYGMQCGALTEDVATMPDNPYGIAKDSLRRFLQELQKEKPYALQWVRFFYLYGPGQNANSLLAQLDLAIESNATVFNMSGGEQLRDYMRVEEAAERIARLIEHRECTGIVNCCSGQPISVRGLVEQRLKERGVTMNLNLSYFPYPDYEPLAFWGNGTKYANWAKTWAS